MPNRASRQFNELYNGMKKGTSTASVPKSMRAQYEGNIKASIAYQLGKKKNAEGLATLLQKENTPEKIDYKGAFTLELYPHPSWKETIPENINVDDNNIVHINNGRVRQMAGGFDVYQDGGFILGAGYAGVKRVKDAQGNVLWENWTEKKKGETHNTPGTRPFIHDNRENTEPEFEIMGLPETVTEDTEFEITLGKEDYEYVKRQACIIDEAEEGFARLAAVTGIKNEDLQSIRVGDDKTNTLVVGVYAGAKIPSSDKNIRKLVQ